jgi:thioredoxin 1
VKKIKDAGAFIADNELCVVEFTGSNCPACKAMERSLSEIEPNFSDIAFCSIDAEESPSDAALFGVLSVPTTFIIVNGMIMDTIIGSIEKEKMESKIMAFMRMAGG